MGAVETVLLPLVRLLLALAAPATRDEPPVALSESLRDAGKNPGVLASALADAAASALGIAAAEVGRLQAADQVSGPSPGDRPKALKLWERLEPCAAAERRWLVERLPEFQQWALAELLWNKSLQAAADDAAVALQLAHLALQIAELVGGDDAWRSLLKGLSRAFVANALRVKGDVRAAEAEFVRAGHYWKNGAGGDPNRILAAWKLPDLEASLRRDLRP